MTTMVPLSEESKMRDKRDWEALAQATSMMLMVSTSSTLKFASSICMLLLFLTTYFFFLFQSAIAMTWAYQDCDKPLRVSEKRAKLARVLKE